MFNRQHGRAEATTDRLVDDASWRAQESMHATQRAARDTLDGLSDTVQEMQDQLAPRFGRLADRAEEIARRGADTMRHQSQALRQRAAQASDMTRGYVRDEPMKSLLIAVAAGAALMAVAGLLGRSSSQRRY